MMQQQRGQSPLPALLIVYLAWILITEITPYLGRLIDPRGISPWLWPAIRMTLMLLASLVYVWRYGVAHSRQASTSA